MLRTQIYELMSDSIPNHSDMLTSNSIYTALAVHDGRRTEIAVTDNIENCARNLTPELKRHILR